jgi:tetratricopeptide (TPR) repeat protein
MPSKRPAAGTSALKLIPARQIDWTAWAAGAVLATAVVMAYSRTFAVPFLFDDELTIVNNPTIRHFGSAFWPPAATTAGGRPVLNLSLAINYAISGTGVWSYHALNLLIHVCAGLVLFGIIRRTLSARIANAATSVAFFAALIWVLHPLQTESVTYIAQRAESLMGLFYLLTLYGFIRAAERDSAKKRGWIALCIGSCLLGMGTKEVMVSAPLIVLLYDRTFLAGGFRAAWRMRRGLYSGLAATWLLLCLLVVSTHGRAGSAGFGTRASPWSYALTQFPAIIHYLRLSLWPHPLIFDYGDALASASLRTWACVLAVGGLAAATLWAVLKNSALGFLGASFFAILAPSSSIVPVATETMAEQRMYLPLAAVVTLIVWGLYRFLGGRSVQFLLLVLAGLLGWMTSQRNEVYRSAMGLWADTVAKRPGNDRAHNYLGLAFEGTPGRLNEAIAQYEESLRLKPGRAEAHNYYGRVLERVPGRSKEVLDQYEEAILLKPGYPDAHNNLGNALNAAGRTAEAIEQYQTALRLNPDYAEAYNNLGNALSMAGKTLEAVPQYEQALRLKPDYVGFHLNFAVTLLRIPGRTDEAIAQLKEVLRLEPDNGPARQILAGINSSSR